MRSSFHLLALALLFAKTADAQHQSITDNWRTERIHDRDLGEIVYHVHKNRITERKPLIVYLEGSGNFPLYSLNPNGTYSSSVTLNLRSMSDDYHIVLISKPNTPLADSIRVAPSGRKQYPMRDGYREKYSLAWRSGAADRVIDAALKSLRVDSARVVVWGHSEGSQVAPAVAVLNRNVTHVIAMMGNSLNHLYDFILHERVSAFNGVISNEEAQANIDSLYVAFARIYNDPTSTTEEWFGETNYKWSSFSLVSPLENMLKLDLPILYVAGGEDRHSILNMDYAKLEFLRKGKANLTYKVFPNVDHGFMETRTDESGKTEWIDHLDEVNAFALEWLNRVAR